MLSRRSGESGRMICSRLVSRMVLPIQSRLPSPARTFITSSAARAGLGASRNDGPDFNALFVGAGYAMFGTPEGPWNISRRLESRLGPRLKVGGVIEVNPARAEAALAQKRESSARDSYENAVVLNNVREYKAKVDSGEAPEPKAIFVATTPNFRGGLTPPLSLEIDLMDLFPNAHIFLEKPVATGEPWEKSVSEAKQVGRLLSAHKGLVSIGYVLRYLKAVQQMKKILQENSLEVMATQIRWISAYELAIKTEWWNKGIMQGPIIEQGTHIADLSRYFGGDVDVDTITAHAVEAYEKPGQLSKKNFDESVIPMEQRIPRATTASWKYKNGAVGTLLHAISLHGVTYSIELEVYADGYQMILSDPYGTPALQIRRPGSDAFETIPTPGDDPYQTEIDCFIDAIENGPNPSILSTYEDAARTYEMTWAIRLASEKTSEQVRARQK